MSSKNIHQFTIAGVRDRRFPFSALFVSVSGYFNRTKLTIEPPTAEDEYHWAAPQPTLRGMLRVVILRRQRDRENEAKANHREQTQIAEAGNPE